MRNFKEMEKKKGKNIRMGHVSLSKFVPERVEVAQVGQ